MGDESTDLTSTLDSTGTLTVSRLFQHLQNPQNLLSYMVFTAWMKFMGIAEHIPSVTIG